MNEIFFKAFFLSFFIACGLAQNDSEELLKKQLNAFEQKQKEQETYLQKLEALCQKQTQEIEQLQTQIQELQSFVAKTKEALVDSLIETTPQKEEILRTEELKQLEELQKRMEMILNKKKSSSETWVYPVVLVLVGISVFLGMFWLQKRARKHKCPRCNGLGYWDGLRSRETCERCHGRGRI